HHSLLFCSCFIPFWLFENAVVRCGVKTRLALAASAPVTWFISTIVPMTFSEMARLHALRPATLDAETALQVGIPDPTWVGTLYPAPAAIFDLVPMLQSHHLSV